MWPHHSSLGRASLGTFTMRCLGSKSKHLKKARQKFCHLMTLPLKLHSVTSTIVTIQWKLWVQEEGHRPPFFMGRMSGSHYRRAGEVGVIVEESFGKYNLHIGDCSPPQLRWIRHPPSKGRELGQLSFLPFFHFRLCHLFYGVLGCLRCHIQCLQPWSGLPPKKELNSVQ